MTPQECRYFGKNLLLPTPGLELIGANSITSSTTLTSDGPGRFLYLDATAGAFTLTLPADPYEGMCFYLSENAGLTTAITVDGNGKNINGSSTITMNAAYRQRVVRYNGTQWIVIWGFN